jgi:predicted dehydrogenase
MLKIAIVGLGWWGRHLFDVIKEVDELDAVMGVDPTPDGRAFCEGQGIAYADRFDNALADPTIDAVLLATPHSLHEGQVIAAVAAGKQVFCEKPLAMTAAGAQHMVDACTKTGRVLGIGHERRFEAGHERLAELVREGRLGKISHVDANTSHNSLAKMPATGWRKDPNEAPAGTWTGIGIHLSDLIVAMRGAPTEVRALADTNNPDIPGAIIRVQLAFADGSTATVTSIANTPFYARFTVHGDAGWAELVDQANVDKGLPAILTIVDDNGNRASEEHSPKTAAGANLRSWARAVLHGEPYRFTPEQLVANAAILEALVRSIEQNGAAIRLQDLIARS